jgi:hypothetical protein
MRRVHLVHGIHTETGDSMVKRLAPYLQDAGLTVFYPDYGWIAGLETRVANPLIVQAMLPYIEPGDLFIGHSNGCAIGYDLMNLGAPFEGAAFINGALEQNITRPTCVDWIDVYWNSGDNITEAAQLAQRLHLVDTVWGEMGHAGYKGNDPLIVNIDCGHAYGLQAVSGHSDLFSKLGDWGPWIAHRVADHP